MSSIDRNFEEGFVVQNGFIRDFVRALTPGRKASIGRSFLASSRAKCVYLACVASRFATTLLLTHIALCAAAGLGMVGCIAQPHAIDIASSHVNISRAILIAP